MLRQKYIPELKEFRNSKKHFSTELRYLTLCLLRDVMLTPIEYKSAKRANSAEKKNSLGVPKENSNLESNDKFGNNSSFGTEMNSERFNEFS
jgi:hypothetical protein